jgi:hypothetical protein
MVSWDGVVVQPSQITAQAIAHQAEAETSRLRLAKRAAGQLSVGPCTIEDGIDQRRIIEVRIEAF